MNGVDMEIKSGKYLNQINDVYTKDVSGFFYNDKRFYVFDFDTSGRDYVEYICDYKNLKLVN